MHTFMIIRAMRTGCAGMSVQARGLRRCENADTLLVALYATVIISIIMITVAITFTITITINMVSANMVCILPRKLERLPY